MLIEQLRQPGRFDEPNQDSGNLTFPQLVSWTCAGWYFLRVDRAPASFTDLATEGAARRRMKQTVRQHRRGLRGGEDQRQLRQWGAAVGLRACGPSVLVASTADAALQLAGVKPDIPAVTTDISMPARSVMDLLADITTNGLPHWRWNWS